MDFDDEFEIAQRVRKMHETGEMSTDFLLLIIIIALLVIGITYFYNRNRHTLQALALSIALQKEAKTETNDKATQRAQEEKDVVHLIKKHEKRRLKKQIARMKMGLPAEETCDVSVEDAARMRRDKGVFTFDELYQNNSSEEQGGKVIVSVAEGGHTIPWVAGVGKIVPLTQKMVNAMLEATQNGLPMPKGAPPFPHAYNAMAALKCTAAVPDGRTILGLKKMANPGARISAERSADKTTDTDQPQTTEHGYTGGARYGTMSGSPHREYTPLDEINKMNTETPEVPEIAPGVKQRKPRSRRKLVAVRPPSEPSSDGPEQQQPGATGEAIKADAVPEAKAVPEVKKKPRSRRKVHCDTADGTEVTQADENAALGQKKKPPSRRKVHGEKPTEQPSSDGTEQPVATDGANKTDAAPNAAVPEVKKKPRSRRKVHGEKPAEQPSDGPEVNKAADAVPEAKAVPEVKKKPRSRRKVHGEKPTEQPSSDELEQGGANKTVSISAAPKAVALEVKKKPRSRRKVHGEKSTEQPSSDGIEQQGGTGGANKADAAPNAAVPEVKKKPRSRRKVHGEKPAEQASDGVEQPAATGGAKFGAISGTPHREYTSLDTVNKAEKDGKKKPTAAAVAPGVKKASKAEPNGKKQK